MASMPNEIILKNELRPCLIDNRFKAMWHAWTQRPARGREGEIAVHLALVEWEDGSMDEVLPTRVRFLDTGNKMRELDIFFHAEKMRKEGEP